MPGSLANSGPARVKTTVLLPAESPGAANQAGSIAMPWRTRRGHCLPHVGLEPREHRIEHAPAIGLGGEARFAVGHRRRCAVGQQCERRRG